MATRDFLRRLNDRHLAQHPGDSELAARISAYELAAANAVGRRRDQRLESRIAGDARVVWRERHERQ